MIKYIGSKRLLVPAIVGIVRSLPDVRTVLDLFSGTSRVGHALKREGYRVHANDHLWFAHALATCYVGADAEDVLEDAARLIAELNGVGGAPGYVTEVFARQSRFFLARNAERIDAIRDRIASLSLGPDLEGVLLTSLLEASDRVDSTAGVQMAYMKGLAPRARNALELRVPDVLAQAEAGKGEATRLEAIECAGLVEADCAYIDPPYNQHSYLGNYHIWETLVRWDAPAHYGVACKRVDCRTRKSAFNSKRTARGALASVIESVRAPNLIVSCNDEGYIAREDVEAILRTRGRVHTIAREAKRYVGAQIGIHNQRGERVGRVGRLRNVEYLFVVVPHDSPWGPSQISNSPADPASGPDADAHRTDATVGDGSVL